MNNLMREKFRKIPKYRNRAILPILAAAMASMLLSSIPNAFATNYWSGWWWSNISHPDEFKNVSGNFRVPYHLIETQINALPWATGTASTEAPNAIVSGGNAWNGISSAWGLTRDETETFFWDHEVGTENLAANILAHTHRFVHPDNHVVDNDVHINNDANDVDWDYQAEDEFTTPRIYDLRKVMIHEFGHWVYLCDTYPPGGTEGACTGVETSSSVMWSYRFGTAGNSLYTHDSSTVTSIYGG